MLVHRNLRTGEYFDEKGNKVVLVACWTPEKGQKFLRPTGKKNQYRIETAQHDFEKNVYRILE